MLPANLRGLPPRFRLLWHCNDRPFSIPARLHWRKKSRKLTLRLTQKKETDHTPENSTLDWNRFCGLVSLIVPLACDRQGLSHKSGLATEPSMKAAAQSIEKNTRLRLGGCQGRPQGAVSSTSTVLPMGKRSARPATGKEREQRRL